MGIKTGTLIRVKTHRTFSGVQERLMLNDNGSLWVTTEQQADGANSVRAKAVATGVMHNWFWQEFEVADEEG